MARFAACAPGADRCGAWPVVRTARHSAGSAKRSSMTVSHLRQPKKAVKPAKQTANGCQTWVSIAPRTSASEAYWLARLAGFEPATRCLEATASATGTVRDVQFFELVTHYRSLRTGTVATGVGYTRAAV